MLAKQKRRSLDEIAAITSHIVNWEAFQQAKVISIYVSLPGEFPTRELIEAAWKAGKRVVIPHVDLSTKTMHMCLYSTDSTLKQDAYGLAIPALCNEVSQIDLAIVPCRAVAKDGTRLGTGGGFYDRFFAAHRVSIRLGLSMYPEIVENLPLEAHDVKMTHMCTSYGIISSSRIYI